MNEKQPFGSQYKKVEYNNVIYLINKENSTAHVIGCEENLRQIIIPSSIIYETTEYNVTNISDNAFRLSEINSILFSSNSKLETIDKRAFCGSLIEAIAIPSSVTAIGENAFCNCRQLEIIEIPDDSKLQTIDSGAFSDTKIDNITIPSELIDLEEGWCIGLPNVIKFKVSPNNPRYCSYEDKLILGKTSIEQSDYDCLIFCIRNIKHIKIPSFIKHIYPNSFNKCNQLDTIEFSEESKLEIIDKGAFCGSSIKKIIIPSSVKAIGENAFHYCEQLEIVEIPDDSKLQIIDSGAFSDTKIDNITIPSELIDLEEGWCIGLPNVIKFKVSPNNPRYCSYEDKLILGKTSIEQSDYDCLIYCIRNIKHIKIPSFIKHIYPNSFDRCNQLDTIEFSEESKLETIDKEAFYGSSIKIITIPSSVTSIGEGSFQSCYQLKRIEIPNDSKLEIFDKGAFCLSAIKSITIPSSVTSISMGAFSECLGLERIIIPNDSKLEIIDNEAFSSSDIRSLSIPSSVTIIGYDTFLDCEQLQIIEINNAELISMYEEQFQYCEDALLMVPIYSKIK